MGLTTQIFEVKAGDLLFSRGCGTSSFLIDFLTGWSGHSHAMIVVPYRNRWHVFESMYLDPTQPCAIQAKPVHGVQSHFLDDVLQRADALYHLPLTTPLTPLLEKRLVVKCLSNLGVQYDLLGAYKAGYLIKSIILGLLYREDVKKLFCSEFVAMILRDLGLLDTDNVSQWNPNRLARKLLRDGIVQPPVRLN